MMAKIAGRVVLAFFGNCGAMCARLWSDSGMDMMAKINGLGCRLWLFVVFEILYEEPKNNKEPQTAASAFALGLHVRA